eukprot:1587451-Ditylum_brightwellii.AAC.1
MPRVGNIFKYLTTYFAATARAGFALERCCVRILVMVAISRHVPHVNQLSHPTMIKDLAVLVLIFPWEYASSRLSSAMMALIEASCE